MCSSTSFFAWARPSPVSSVELDGQNLVTAVTGLTHFATERQKLKSQLIQDEIQLFLDSQGDIDAKGFQGESCQVVYTDSPAEFSPQDWQMSSY